MGSMVQQALCVRHGLCGVTMSCVRTGRGMSTPLPTNALTQSSQCVTAGACVYCSARSHEFNVNVSWLLKHTAVTAPADWQALNILLPEKFGVSTGLTRVLFEECKGVPFLIACHVGFKKSFPYYLNPWTAILKLCLRSSAIYIHTHRAHTPTLHCRCHYISACLQTSIWLAPLLNVAHTYHKY